MIYVKMKNEIPIDFSFGYPEKYEEDNSWQCRWDWPTLEKVQSISSYLTAMTGDIYLGVDRGEHVSPRYDIVKAPKVGDPVSYAFNGDTYPDGEIVKVTKTLQVTTSAGHKYLRKKMTGTWLMAGGTWSLVMGHVYTQNPHF